MVFFEVLVIISRCTLGDLKVSLKLLNYLYILFGDYLCELSFSLNMVDFL